MGYLIKFRQLAVDFILENMYNNKKFKFNKNKSMKNNMDIVKSSKQGFTLIELLIVIAIIGILAVALLPSVLGAPARARDAAKHTAIDGIIAGVESFNSANGHYPVLASGGTGCLDPATLPATSDLGLLNTYFKGAKVPVPAGTSAIGGCTNQFIYCPLAAPYSYAIGVQMEMPGATEGYRANTPAITSQITCATAAAAAVANGNYFLSVQ